MEDHLLMVKSTISTEPCSMVFCMFTGGFFDDVFFEFPMAYLDGLDIIA